MKIDIFGDIIGGESERWSAGDFATSDIVDALKAANGEAVEININSNGGSVTGGIAIANAIKQYPGETTCNVLGVAASIASVIACACDNLRMGEGSFLMIHNPFTVTMGTADDLRNDADTLDKMRDAIISFYRAKCDKSEDEIKALMDAETWLSRDEAKAGGWAVTDYEGSLKAAASLTRRAFDHAPEAARAFLSVAEKADAPKEEKPAENWEARFKGLSTKYNEVKAEYDARLDALAAENKQLKDQLDQTTHDLAGAKAKASELAAKVEEGAKTLLKANEDLAQTRDSLKAAEDKAAHLESTRDMLTAGVLTPPSVDNSYAAKMKAAKTAEEREALRAAKKAGKIK